MVNPGRPSTFLAATLLFTVLFSGVASAATFNSGVLASGAGGSIKVDGTVTWASARSFDYTINSQDIGPQDGLGAAFYFQLKEVGSPNTYLTDFKGSDTNGCGNGFDQASARQNWPQQLKWVVVIWRATNAGSCATYPGSGPFPQFFNPYV